MKYYAETIDGDIIEWYSVIFSGKRTFYSAANTNGAIIDDVRNNIAAKSSHYFLRIYPSAILNSYLNTDLSKDDINLSLIRMVWEED